MKLEFATIYKNRPTYFVEKIWAGLFDYLFNSQDPENTSEVFQDYGSYLEDYRQNHKDPNHTVFNDEMQNIYSKVHTIRKDEDNEWCVGMTIRPVIKTRNDGHFQFAPSLKVKAIQRIKITYVHGKNRFPLVEITSDLGEQIKQLSPVHHFNYITEMDNIARNSGFNDFTDFLSWFDTGFTGRIIHWTNFKYV